jgi:transcriptional regulator with XRE-family HTH domain
MTGMDRYERGSWICAYRVSPVVHRPTPSQLLSLISEIKGHETGWPVWLLLHSRENMRPRIVDGVIECWLYETEDEDFWRADPDGHMFLIRRLQEDTREIQGMQPGRCFEFTLPIWRVPIARK